MRRTVALSVNPGVVAAYVHNAASPELGKIGVLVALKSTADKDKLAALGQAARHACRRGLAAGASRPNICPRMWWSASAPCRWELARQSGKPEAVIEKMMEGRMRKFYEETVLLSQTFVIDGETQVGKVLEKAAKDLGAPIDDRGLCPLPGGRGHREGRKRFRRRSRANGRATKPLTGRIERCMPTAPKYRRVLLKVSGEALMGDGQLRHRRRHRGPHRRAT